MLHRVRETAAGEALFLGRRAAADTPSHLHARDRVIFAAIMPAPTVQKHPQNPNWASAATPILAS